MVDSNSFTNCGHRYRNDPLADRLADFVYVLSSLLQDLLHLTQLLGWFSVDGSV